MSRKSTGRTPRAMKQKDGNFVNPGVVGRATGITLPAKQRDEHGMEILDGLFSSPEKSPPKRNGVALASTILEQDDDETMDVGSSTIPEPAEVMKAGNRRVLPPPKSRSPIKTSLGSAARRSLGPLSSPSRRAEHDTPTHRAMSHPPNRRLDFSMSESYSSVRSSAGKKKLPTTQGTKFNPASSSGKRKRGIFDVPTDTEEELANDHTKLTNGAGLTNGFDDSQNVEGAAFDQSLHLENGIDPSQIEDNQMPLGQETISPSIEKDSAPVTKKVKGRKRGRSNTVAELVGVELASNAVPSPARRGRPAKKQKPNVPVEEPVGEAADEPAEPEPEPVTEPTKKSMQPPKSKPGRKAGLALKDPNTKLRPRQRARSISKGPQSPSKVRMVARSETPGDELSFRTTRVGRNVFKPLAYWRGEAKLFGDGIKSQEDKDRMELPPLKEVIRVEEVVELRRRKPAGRRRRPTRRLGEDDLPEDDVDEAEYWETDAGVMRASVMLWNPKTTKGDEEATEDADVAYAASAIEMRDIQGADFRFAKTLTLPFFGSGMVDLPPGGTKRIKNSRKMQMVFFVFYGRVTVELGTPTQRFSIGRGGMWQVPRGNFYAIHNHTQKHARIFFAQGCEVAPDSVFGPDESGAAA
ncbi:MAG: hypothetical protein LQ352_002405 [Teloschistes flavicans]|nr:MAG: hypothetical protein LQ352_002405 [Teloschistes flavicans]